MSNSMKSLKELYKRGRGPSSSHTMGPSKAAEIYARRHPDAKGFKVTLFGSLAATGKGHLTDVAIKDKLEPVAPVEIVWNREFLPFHPYAMKFAVKASDGLLQDEWTVYSIGGGTISEGEADALEDSPEVYPLNTMSEIQEWCQANGYKPSLQSRGLVHAYALAVSEQNAAEMGLEHHLGMTRDPVCGLVQVPCIERNAFAATRALDANFYAMFSDGRHIVSFDDVVKVMKQTGHDLPNLYKETGIGGLAASYQKSDNKSFPVE